MSDRVVDPLPREWLPDPVSSAAGDDPQVWEWRIQRLKAAAGPRLERLRGRRTPWWSLLGALWRPAAVVAVAAVALVLLVPSPRKPQSPGTLALNVVATEGSPAGLWASLGSEAEPALALIALEGDVP